MPRVNPYSPGQMASPGMFAGRYAEMMALESLLFQNEMNKAQHFAITGPRGIGKSSLLLLLQQLGTGVVESSEHGRFRSLVARTALEPETNYYSLYGQITESIATSLAQHESMREVGRSIWDFVRQCEVAGVKLPGAPPTPQQHQLLPRLIDLICDTLARTSDRFRGLVILIDEADRATSATNLGGFLKAVTESLTTRDCNNVCIGLAGATGMLERLRSDHPSAPRIVQVFDLKPLVPDERLEVLRKGLVHANRMNALQTAMSREAQVLIAGLSEGFPHFLQQFGYSAFEEDTDALISPFDVWRGANKENGALQQLGEKYFHLLQQETDAGGPTERLLRAQAQLTKNSNWVHVDRLAEVATVDREVANAVVHRLSGLGLLRLDPVNEAVSLPDASYGAWMRASLLRESALATADGASDRKAAELRALGFPARMMLGAFSAQELRGVYSPAELREAGFEVAEFRGVFDAAELIPTVGLAELVKAGYTVDELVPLFADAQLVQFFPSPDIARERYKERMAESATELPIHLEKGS